MCKGFEDLRDPDDDQNYRPHAAESVDLRIEIVQEKQRAIQIRRNAELVGSVEEVHVEGFQPGTGQWIGRTSQNRTLNFTHSGEPGPLTGRYLEARVTRSGPNSLVGEACVA